jgi:ABC-type dipeptide/oligopeptide/nickel transport system permease subunit
MPSATETVNAAANSSQLWRALRKDGRSWLGLGVVTLLVLLALAAPLVANADPVKIDLLHTLEAPSATHWMGTDAQGRDVWSRLVHGAPLWFLNRKGPMGCRL